MNRDHGCVECDLADDGRHTSDCLRDQLEDRRVAAAVREARHRALTDAIGRIEKAIQTRPFHTDYGLAKQDGLRDAVSELRMMILDGKRSAASVTLCDARVLVGDSECEERCGNPWPCATHGGNK